MAFRRIVVGAFCVILIAVMCACSDSSEKSSDMSTPDEVLEQAVSDAIIAHNQKKFGSNDTQTFATEYHKILKTERQQDSTVVYLVAFYAQYQSTAEGGIELTEGSSTPCVITFTTSDKPYQIEEYWEPQDGESYDESIRNKFPEDIGDVSTDILGPDAMEICNQRAREYFSEQE